MPQSTLRAFAEHGSVDQTLDPRLDAPKAVLSAGAAEGLDMAAITSELEHEGVNAFCDSYEQLLSCLEDKVTSLAEAAR
jgi:transaldolase